MSSFPPATATIRAGDIVVALGNSLSSAAYVYYQSFRDSVDAHFAGLGAAAVTWVDSGVSGAAMLPTVNPSFSVGNAYQTYVTQFNPHCLLCEIGVNDVGLATPWDPVLFESLYRAFLFNCLAGAPNLAPSRILINTPWFYGEPTGAAEPAMNQCMVATMNIAQAIGCAHLDYRSPRIRTGGQTIDGIHPTSPGKIWMSGRLSAAVTLVP